MTKKELLDKKVSAVSLGCDKNQVDLEKMLGRIKDYGLEVIAEVEYSDIVIVNTCAFIQPAIEEAISNIIEMEELKKLGKFAKLLNHFMMFLSHASLARVNGFSLILVLMLISKSLTVAITHALIAQFHVFEAGISQKLWKILSVRRKTWSHVA